MSSRITSGFTGYEKPNPRAFEYALRQVGHPERVCMVGDNPIADVQGAESMGIPAILVRSQHDKNVKYYANDLQETTSIIEYLKSL